jgi:polar amino acid transport system substrate-binding protein
MKFLGLCGVLLAAGLAAGGAKAQEAAVKELIPTGKLRFGVAFAPKMSALFVVKDADGSPRGVTADLGTSWHSALACRSSLWSRLTPAC